MQKKFFLKIKIAEKYLRMSEVVGSNPTEGRIFSAILIF